ncbi:hypothetical protein JHK85_001281 [Glycine max]|nr:hypothetical protein JHK85_001281 [Glycine max]
MGLTEVKVGEEYEIVMTNPAGSIAAGERASYNGPRVLNVLCMWISTISSIKRNVQPSFQHFFLFELSSVHFSLKLFIAYQDIMEMDYVQNGEILYIPGTMTPTEIYPISALGGFQYISALKKAFPHISMVASQGITIDQFDQRNRNQPSSEPEQPINLK